MIEMARSPYLPAFTTKTPFGTNEDIIDSIAVVPDPPIIAIRPSIPNEVFDNHLFCRSFKIQEKPFSL